MQNRSSTDQEYFSLLVQILLLCYKSLCFWIFSTVIRQNKTPLAADFVRKGAFSRIFPFFKGHLFSVEYERKIAYNNLVNVVTVNSYDFTSQ